MWLYIKNFVTERKYYIRLNNYKSELYQSAVGIPQGSVISPVLCNLYTSDSIEKLSIQGQTEMLSALMQYIKCTSKFSQN